MNGLIKSFYGLLIIFMLVSVSFAIISCDGGDDDDNDVSNGDDDDNDVSDAADCRLPESCGDDYAEVTNDEELAAALSESDKCICLSTGEFERGIEINREIVIGGCGKENTKIKATDSTAVIVKADNVTVMGLTIESNDYGITAEGVSDLNILEVNIDCTGSVALKGVDVVGLITQNGLINGSDEGNIAVVLSGSEATLENITVEGFAKAGVVTRNSDVNFSDSKVNSVSNVAVWVGGGTMSISEINIEDTKEGSVGLTSMGFGLVASEGAEVTAGNLSVKNSAHTGVVFDNATGELTDTNLSGNGFGGFWAQNISPGAGMSSAVTLKGENMVIENNEVAGIYGIDVVGLIVQNGIIRSTQETEIPKGSGGDLIVGDGLFVLGAALSTEDAAITVEGTEFQDNSRAALLFDGTASSVGAELSGINLSAISINDGEGQHGLITQNGQEPVQLREGLDNNAFKDSDANFAGQLPVFGEHLDMPSSGAFF